MWAHQFSYDIPALAESERYRGAWWRNSVRPGRATLPVVEAPAAPASSATSPALDRLVRRFELQLLHRPFTHLLLIVYHALNGIDLAHLGLHLLHQMRELLYLHLDLRELPLSFRNGLLECTQPVRAGIELLLDLFRDRSTAAKSWSKNDTRNFRSSPESCSSCFSHLIFNIISRSSYLANRCPRWTSC